MKAIVWISALILFTANFLQGQTLPPTALAPPVKYIHPDEDVNFDKSDQRKPGDFWNVYSDRSNNVTYTGERGSQEFKTIQFMESFWVAEESDKRLHIVKDPNFQSGNFSSSAVDYGWVDKDKLLLWNHCLVTVEGKVNKKGMVLNTIESLQSERIIEGQEQGVVYRTDPELKTQSNKQSRIYEVLFIYKFSEDGSSILLGKNYYTDAYHAKDDIFGWVPKTKITIWDHRIAIEPNWDEKAADERMEKRLPVKFFMDEKRAKNYKECDNVANRFILWDNDSYDKRNIGTWRRFPMLDYDAESDVVFAGVMGELRSFLSKKDTINTVDFADILKRYNDMRAKRRNINVVFVIDGTLSMDPFFSPIGKAIQRSMESLESQYTKNTLRFGAVVYTDYAEGPMLKRVKRLSSDYNDVARWIESTQVIHQNDKDQPEAVYYGLMTALRATGLDENETNILVLVGDAGNHHRNDASQIDENVLIDLMFGFNCNMLAIQVHHADHSSYTEFEAQMKNLIKNTAIRKYNQINPLAESIGKAMEVPKFVPYKGSASILDTTVLIGVVIPCQKGATVSTQRVLEAIDNVVLFSSNLTDKNLNMLEKVIAEGASFDEVVAGEGSQTIAVSSEASGSSYTPAIIDMLRQIGIPQEKLNIILSENYQLYTKAYAPMSVNCLEEPLFKEILFLTRRELGELLGKFEELVTAISGSEQRTKMKETWLQLLQAHLGEKYSRQELENMTLETATRNVFGLPGTSQLLNVRIGDISDPAAVSDAKFYDYIVNIKNKRVDLTKIYNSRDYKYGFYSYDTPYYWISQDLLP